MYVKSIFVKRVLLKGVLQNVSASPVGGRTMTGPIAPTADEQIDIYDWRGRWTGETLPKKDVHTQGRIHICTHGVIVNDSAQVITQFRGPGVKLMRNVWDVISVAGHITALTPEERADPANWDIIQQAWNALVREFDEEIGVDLSGHEPFSDDVEMFGVTRTDQDTEDGWRDRTLSVNFMIRMPHIKVHQFRLEAGKVLDVQWMHVSDIEEWLNHGTGEPLATREPDNYRLLQGVADCARRMTPNND
jgi:hypothetical protein